MITSDNLYYDIVVIGGGPAGMSAAAEAKRTDNNLSVLIVERDYCLGGILNQCIHPGFGLKVYNKELTGPEYAAMLYDDIKKLDVKMMTDTMVLDICNEKSIAVINKEQGVKHIKYRALILAMGCRERTRGAISLPGSRPAGIFTAGTAQRFINIMGSMVGRKVVILGSGDIGMIMARRLTLEGVKVKAVVEILPYLSGLLRNRVQCLDDFDIPLYLSHTVARVYGNDRVEGVSIAPVDDDRKPMLDKAWDLACDTLLLSVGLIPENELSKKGDVKLNNITGGVEVSQEMESSQDGVFACGNVVHVNDLVDNVTIESYIAGKAAAAYATQKKQGIKQIINVISGDGVRYVVPQSIQTYDKEDITTRLYLRVNEPSANTSVIAAIDNNIIGKTKVKKASPGEIIDFDITLSAHANYNGDIIVKTEI